MMVAYSAGALATMQAHNSSTTAQRVRRFWDVEAWPASTRRRHEAATTKKPSVKTRQRHNFLPGCGVSGLWMEKDRKEVERSEEAGRYLNHRRWTLNRIGSGREMRMICVKMSSAPMVTSLEYARAYHFSLTFNEEHCEGANTLCCCLSSSPG